MLLQSTVALTVSRNYFGQPSAIMCEVTQSKQPLTMRKFPKDGSFATFHTTIPT